MATQQAWHHRMDWRCYIILNLGMNIRKPICSSKTEVKLKISFCPRSSFPGLTSRRKTHCLKGQSSNVPKATFDSDPQSWCCVLEVLEFRWTSYLDWIQTYFFQQKSSTETCDQLSQVFFSKWSLHQLWNTNFMLFTFVFENLLDKCLALVVAFQGPGKAAWLLCNDGEVQPFSADSRVDQSTWVSPKLHVNT